MTLKPEYVIVVDDGSTDRKTEILNDVQKDWNGLYVITHQDKGYGVESS
jgi:glycosyltransferase involved in cell wall biosynthesis